MYKRQVYSLFSIRIVDDKNPYEGRVCVAAIHVSWPDSPLKVQTSAGGALDGYAYAELDGNIRIAVPANWAAGEVGTVALEWAPQGGSQRLVAYVEASYDSAPPPFGSVNIVKFEVQTGNGP